MNLNSFQNMHLKCVKKVLSHTIADSLETLLAVGKLSSSAQDTIDFIDIIDELFNLFNSHLPNKKSDIDKIKHFIHHLKILVFKYIF